MDNIIGFSTINYEVYEDTKNLLGMASAVLPDLSYLTQAINGAGIAGNIEAVIPQVDAMTLTLNFRTIDRAGVRLSEPRYHTIDLRAAQQVNDPVTGEINTQGIKHVMRVIPKKYAPGTVAPATPTNGSGEYAVGYWALWVDGEKILEVDPLNNILYLNGTDYLAAVRKALGR